MKHTQHKHCWKVFQNLARIFFPKKFVRKLFRKFLEFPKNFRQETFRKFSGKLWETFSGRRPVRKPPKSLPGLFRKTGGLFVRIRFGNVCFPHKFRGKICMVSLRIPVVSRKIPGGISPGIPGNSGGKIRVFFPVFSMFHGCNAGLTP